ncbi:MAG: YidC/Oxa1 family membrane protein insertase [Candidatus Eremiobacteraeota bacterium]|nr:YidC/Oxa1 family membrane protein insertase [Candidatus Eremiobacteraeota bacterium]
MQYIQQFLMQVIDFLYELTGNYGWSIVILSGLIKVALYIPTNQQYKAMKDMQAIQPEIKKLQEKFKDDPQKMNAEMMLLYKKHKVNPLGGCIPLLIQMPILWGIWQTISGYNEVFARAYFLWIGSPLSYKYPAVFAKSLAGHDMPLLILYGFSMYLTQKTSTSDPATAKAQMGMSIFMPIFFTYMMWQWKFPCALILYWLMFNLLSVFQQAMIMKSSKPAPAVEKGAAL